MIIKFGAWAPPLKKQLASVPVNRATVAVQQLNADAVTRLVLHGLLTDAAARRARKRILRKLERVLTLAERKTENTNESA